MRTEGNACPAVHALDGLALFSKGYSSNQAGILAFSTACAYVLMEYNTTVGLSLQCTSRTRPHAGRIVAPPTNHNAEVAFYPALGLDLDRAVLKRYIPSVNSAAGKHAAQAPNAPLWVGYLQAAALFRLRLLLWYSLSGLDS